jgi:hypothetical protein
VADNLPTRCARSHSMSAFVTRRGAGGNRNSATGVPWRVIPTPSPFRGAVDQLRQLILSFRNAVATHAGNIAIR